MWWKWLRNRREKEIEKRKKRGNEWKGWDKEKIKRSWKVGDSKRRGEERRERREEMNQKGGTKRR